MSSASNLSVSSSVTEICNFDFYERLREREGIEKGKLGFKKE